MIAEYTLSCMWTTRTIYKSPNLAGDLVYCAKGKIEGEVLILSLRGPWQARAWAREELAKCIDQINAEWPQTEATEGNK